MNRKKEDNKIQRYGIWVSLVSLGIAGIALRNSCKSLDLAESQSQKRAIVSIYLDCSEINSNNPDIADKIILYANNEGNIDAQVLSLEVTSSNFNCYEENVMIPQKSSKKIFETFPMNPIINNYIIANYKLKYISNNGNGDTIVDDTIFCK